MIKQAGTLGYVSISGRKIAAIVLILICSFVVAWATRSGKGNKSDTSVKPAQPLVAHINHAPMGGRPVSPATHNHSKAAGKAHTDHRQGALSNFKAHTIQRSRARQSKGAGLTLTREVDWALTREPDRALTKEEPDKALTQSRTQHQLRHRRKVQARHRIQHLV